jgi:nitroreductase
MDNIDTRRSVRAFTQQALEPNDIERLLRAGMQAPSAVNQQPWEFMVIQDKEMLDIVSLTSPYSRLAAKAPLAIVPLADEQRMRSPSHWEQDLAAATQNILLRAVNLGLGAVWMGVAPSEERMGYLSNCLELPAHIRPFALVAVGHPASGTGNKYVDRFDASRIHYERY